MDDAVNAELPAGAARRLRTHDGLQLHLQALAVRAMRAAACSSCTAWASTSAAMPTSPQHLNAWGWSVVGYDQRGHGRSEGPRGRLGTDDDLLHDLALVIDAVRASHGPARCCCWATAWAGWWPRASLPAAWPRPQPWFRAVDALVLSSPALDPGMNAGQKLLLALLGRLAPNLAVNNGLKPAWISRDPQVVRNYVADPLVHDRITPRLARFIVDGGVPVRERAAAWTRADAADVGRQRPLRRPGRQRRLCGGRTRRGAARA